MIGEALVPTDSDEYRRHVRRKELEARKGVEIEYYCSDCGDYFTQFYDESALEAFFAFIKGKYDLDF